MFMIRGSCPQWGCGTASKMLLLKPGVIRYQEIISTHEYFLLNIKKPGRKSTYPAGHNPQSTVC